MRIRQILMMLTAVVILTTACSAQIVSGQKPEARIEAELVESEASACPTTQPPERRFVPPEPWPETPPQDDQFWYGKGGLWTALPNDGSWAQLQKGEKVWWWSEDFDVSEDSTPDLTVTARKLDKSGLTYASATEATNGYHKSFHWAMLTGVELPADGCWEITGEYNGRALSFVVWVPAE